MSEQEQLLKEYLKQLDLKSHNTKQPFVMAMVGLVGSGKSTFAKELASKTGLYVDSNDVIRRFLNQKGYVGDAPVQETLQFIGQGVGNYLRKHNVSLIIDADVMKFYEMAQKNATKDAMKFYLVSIECADAIIRSRIIARTKQLARNKKENHSRADIAEYEKRKAIHDATLKPAFDFVVHTDKPLEPQIKKICAKLIADGVL